MAIQKARPGGTFDRDGARNGQRVYARETQIGLISRGGVDNPQIAVDDGFIWDLLLSDTVVAYNGAICTILPDAPSRGIERTGTPKKKRIIRKKARAKKSSNKRARKSASTGAAKQKESTTKAARKRVLKSASPGTSKQKGAKKKAAKKRAAKRTARKAK